MRILLISEIPPPYGGVSLWTESFMREAPRRGFDVELMHGGARGDDFLSTKVRARRAYRAHVRPALRILSGGARAFDVVHVCSSGGASFVRSLVLVTAARAARKPAVLHLHSAAATCPSWALGYAAWLARSGRCVVATPCHEDATRLGFVTLVDNLVDRDSLATIRWRTEACPGTLRLAYFGWIIREKGLFELLDALVSTPAASVDLYGPQVRPDEFARLMAAARDRGLGRRFVYRGQVPHRDVAATMSAYDAVILPSHGESFGLVAAEAMSVGVPVIGSRVGFLWDAPDDVAEKLLEVSAEAIARTLARLLEDPARLKRLSEGGRAHSAAFHADRIMPVWQNLYRSIVQRSGGTQDTGGEPR